LFWLGLGSSPLLLAAKRYATLLRNSKNEMIKNNKYIIDVLKAISVFTLFPNVILFIFWQLDDGTGLSSIMSLIFNSLILPLVLIFSVNRVNEKFNKNWWYLNYIIFALCILFSIYLSLFFWILNVEKNGGFYGRHNIDSGTWMIVNLETMIAFGIISLGLMSNIIEYVANNLKSKT
jgi:hypothetical protein